MSTFPGHPYSAAPAILSHWGPRPWSPPPLGSPGLKEVGKVVTPANNSLLTLAEKRVRGHAVILNSPNIIVPDPTYFRVSLVPGGVNVTSTVYKSVRGVEESLSFGLTKVGSGLAAFELFLRTMSSGKAGACLGLYEVDGEEYELWVLTSRA